MNLEGRVALVTGASQGIGHACALHLARQGASVAVAARNRQKLDELVAAIGAAGGKAAAFPVDVADEEQVKSAVKAAIAQFGKIDILVNNAGITRDNLLIRMSEQDWDLVLDVNLKGAFNFCKAVAKPMMKARSGAIVNVASVVGLMGNTGQANYAASKGGLIAMTKAMAKELAGRNVRVNAVAPGFIRTRMTEVLPEEAKKTLLMVTPLARFGEPEEVSKVLLFLASEDASYVTGQVVGVNGGMYM